MPNPRDWSPTSANNTSIDGFPISNSTLASNVDDIIRSVMAGVATLADGGQAEDPTLDTDAPYWRLVAQNVAVIKDRGSIAA